MHGGALGSGAPEGKRNGAYKRGHYTAEVLAELSEMRALLRAAKAALEDEE